MSRRLQLIRPAVRPKMSARALFQGPQGSGKTWTMLSVARSLVAGTEGRILGLDTERESMLTYADVFTFEHLPWRPPYSPDELTQTLDKIATDWVRCPDDVVVIDSTSHFWTGSGGILDVAGGRVQGGWDKARPMQQALVEQLLAMPCHVLLGARMKNTVLVSDAGKTIENVGLTITGDETLGYELNIVVQMDMQHNLAVMKSRTPAVPVGRLYPGGAEGKLADDYAEWLAGGIPPANREDVEAIVEVFAGVADSVRRKALKDGFVEAFGMPHSLTAEQVPDARKWLADQGAAIGSGPAADDGDQEAATSQDSAQDGPGADAVADGAGDPEPSQEEQEAQRVRYTLAEGVGKLTPARVRDLLEAAGQSTSGRTDTLRARLLAVQLLQADLDLTDEETERIDVPAVLAATPATEDGPDRDPALRDPDQDAEDQAAAEYAEGGE